jgi:hypothetical protein
VKYFEKKFDKDDDDTVMAFLLQEDMSNSEWSWSTLSIKSKGYLFLHVKSSKTWWFKTTVLFIIADSFHESGN